jgi:branched-chain amino acid transport system permease protein
MTTEVLAQSLVSGLTQGCIYALIGLGFTIIFSVTGIINFAQGEFVMLGGMFSYFLAKSAGFSVIPALIISVLIAMLIGAVLYLMAIRTARRASVISLIIITIGASIFITGIANQLWGPDPVAPPYFTGDGSVTLLGASVQYQALWIIGTTLFVTLILHLFFSYTMIGKALKASAMNRTAAGLVGVNSKTMSLIAFVLAAALGALGGVVTAPLSLVSYNVGAMLGVKGFVAASIGGFRSHLLTILGGIGLGVVESVAVALNWGPFTSRYKEAIALVVLLLILLIRSRKLAEEERAS